MNEQSRLLTMFMVNMQIWLLFLAIPLLQIDGTSSSKNVWKQRFNKLTNAKFTQGRSELVFLLDRSGSVGAANFEIEKGFVENLLTNFVVAPNATRVAVITYSRTATLHINYIKSPKNKCFLSEELQEVAYEGSEQTNTAAALLAARTALRSARKNVNKVVILLSDGISTAGKDPVEVAKLLKADNIEIFTFAIGKFLRLELDAIATSSDHTFNVVNFRQFRKLARRIRGDPHETKWHASLSIKSCDYLCNNPYVGQAFNPGCCDVNAKCTCGLISGLYNCVCGPGYFGESGLMGDCQACPVGTYKDNYEPSYKCTKCPRRSTTANESSTSMSHCRCIDGYHGNPSKGQRCKINKCPPLQAPTNGKILGRCSRKYKSTCYFSCDVGFKVADVGGRERTCQADKTWSGVTTICTTIACPNLETPRNGRKSCTTNNNDWGTVCTFQCNTGFIRMGSKSRMCGPGGLWSGYQPECQIVTCPALQNLQYGRITPSSCVVDRTPFNKPCFFQCVRGFERIGPHYMICNAQGTWEGRLPTGEPSYSTPMCKDVEKPQVNCPAAIEVKAEPGAKYAWVSWKRPIFWDNSGLPTKVQWNPNYRKEKAKFNIGTHKIVYKGSDGAFQTTVCEVIVTVIDREPPRVLSCPNDILANTTELEEPIFWTEPEFLDNSGEKLTIISSVQPGQRFQVGKWLVLYIATDSSGNDATCEFNIIVNKNTCPYHPAPVNGALTCSDWLRGEFCQVYCNDRFDFARTPANWYICGRESVWKTIPANAVVPWPDCSVWYIPKVVRKLVGHYFTGNCKSKKVQKTIKQTFINYFKQKFDKSKYCKEFRSCKVESVKVKCGQRNNSIPVGRRKRDIGQNFADSFEIELDIVVEANSEMSQKKELIEDLLSTAGSLASKQDFEDDKTDEIVVNRQKGLSKDETQLECNLGQIKRNDECVNCPVGTFYDDQDEACHTCPVGFYQDEEAQLECRKCPPGQSTTGDHNRNFTECKNLCKEGTFSKTGLETCAACPRGTYQNVVGQSKCIKCPPHTTTWTVQAKNITFCQEKCLPGSFSDTGLRECTDCPVGYYQESYGQQYCKECQGALSTLSRGSSSRSSCVKVNHCKTDSCKNGGTCSSLKHGIACSCPIGFVGPQCNNETDDCISSPCQHNSTCVDKVGDFECICEKGFTGKMCEEEVNECFLFPCLNGGTCVDKMAAYKCFCPQGYAGDRCQIDLDMCEGEPCGANGRCKDVNDTFECECNAGFEGETCDVNLNDCIDVMCHNGGTCSDGINSYACQCASGFTGRHCETNTDDCVDHKCMNGASCVDLIDEYRCSCRPAYSGNFCEQKLPWNFILAYEHAKLSNYAAVDTVTTLGDFTVDMWVQSKFEQRQTGTMLSYAVADDNSVVDNALTIMDPSNVRIFINGQTIFTDLEIDDGTWHRLTFSWSGSTNGLWKLYLDDQKTQEGNIAAGKTIKGGGMLVVGQDQDNIGGNFNIVESFVGNVSKIAIWNKILSPEAIADSCKSATADDDALVVAWPDFLAKVHGDVKIIRNACPV